MRSARLPTPGAPVVQHDTRIVRLVRGGTLDHWLTRAWDNGVQIDRLDDLQTLVVQTRNSTYELAIVSSRAGKMLVRGGRYFPAWTPVQFAGSSFGGSLLKRHGVYVGMRMELHWAGRHVITSPVHSIARATAVHPTVMN